jgi:hypothetical protein
MMYASQMQNERREFVGFERWVRRGTRSLDLFERYHPWDANHPHPLMPLSMDGQSLNQKSLL